MPNWHSRIVETVIQSPRHSFLLIAQNLWEIINLSDWAKKNIWLNQRALFERYVLKIMIKVTLTRIINRKSSINYQELVYPRSYIKSCALKIITKVTLPNIIHHKSSINQESSLPRLWINWHILRIIIKPWSSINYKKSF